MTHDAESLLESALRLPESERAELATRLIDSLDPDPDEGDVEAAWSEEVRRRLEDVEQGRVKPVPWDEVRRRMLDDSDGPDAR